MTPIPLRTIRMYSTVRPFNFIALRPSFIGPVGRAAADAEAFLLM